MIDWDLLEAGDTISMVELHKPDYPGDCPAEVKAPMPTYCLRDRGHNGQHVAIDPSGYVMITWMTLR